LPLTLSLSPFTGRGNALEGLAELLRVGSELAVASLSPPAGRGPG